MYRNRFFYERSAGPLGLSHASQAAYALRLLHTLQLSGQELPARLSVFAEVLSRCFLVPSTTCKMMTNASAASRSNRYQTVDCNMASYQDVCHKIFPALVLPLGQHARYPRDAVGHREKPFQLQGLGPFTDLMILPGTSVVIQNTVLYIEKSTICNFVYSISLPQSLASP